MEEDRRERSGYAVPLPYEFEGMLATEESDAVGGWKSYLMIRVAMLHPRCCST